jgi:hypothetical protein
MSDQKQRLVEEHDMSEEEAEQVYKSMKTQVMLLAQSAERDWDKDEYEAVTDVLMGIQHQQAEMMEQMEQSRLATVARYLPTLLAVSAMAGALVGFWVVLTVGITIPAATLIGLSFILTGSSFVLS